MWFDDGNIIIMASESQVAFRLYEGMLASVSPIFKDLFAVPQLADAETMYGCPVVRLPDSPEDLQNFLCMLFNPGYL